MQVSRARVFGKAREGIHMLTRRQVLSGAAAIGAIGLGQNGLAGAAKGKIQKAVLLSMLPKEMPYLDRFRLAVDVGFRQMEAGTVDTDAQAQEIKDAADKADLRIHSVMNQAHWRHPLSSPDPSVVETSLKGMEASLRQAKLYGADAVLLVPAVVQPDTDYEQAWERSQREIRKLIPMAEKLGVVIAVENVWNKFLLTARDFIQYIDEFNTPLVRAYFDVGNIVHYGFPEHWIRKVGKRLLKVHLKDYERETRQFVNLGEGSIDWDAVRTAFDEIGYTGVATVELRRGDRDYLADVSKRVDRLLALS